MTQEVFIGLTLLFMAYEFYGRWQINRKYHRLRREHACEEPPVDSNHFPGGLDHIWKVLTYKGDDILDDLLMPRFSRLGHTFGETILGHRTLHTCDLRNFQAILGTTWENFEVGPARKGAFEPFIKRGMLCTDGMQWKRARELVKPLFARGQLNDFGSTERQIGTLLMAMPMENDSGWTTEIDLLGLFSHMALDMFTEFSFGEAVGSQLSNLTADQERETEKDVDNQSEATQVSGKAFAQAFLVATEYTMDRALLQGFYFLKDGFHFRKSLATVHKYVDGIVHRALNSKNDDAKAPNQVKRYDFISELIASTQDTQEIRDSALTLVLAGRDTTAGLLGWIFFFLARQPQVFKRLRSEILTRFGSEAVPSELDYPMLKSLPYLQSVINETLRLRPVVALTNRICAQDTVLPSGGGSDGKQPLVVMKGDKIFLYFYAAHRREEIWGSDAADFRPERWEDRRIGWDYLPFGGGPRVCVGRESASHGKTSRRQQ